MGRRIIVCGMCGVNTTRKKGIACEECTSYYKRKIAYQLEENELGGE